uniref:Uncharacterized protein n=1 Tax=Pseudo-nitzschia australis TaxID=44445 RepID=A0A7S4EM31_9STRA|mmetsp:Transcript_10915/g.23250  ORF Transcript_10915/g.23250 Transcript_10915/m.23250 type:complete len:191 (+) Transcript_10915:212-784(+)
MADITTSTEREETRSKGNAHTDVTHAGADSDSDVDTAACAPLLPKSPFITTSDIINRLNTELSDLSSACNNNNGTDMSVSSISSTNTPTSASQQQQPRFELQKRLPDGSAIPATRDETAAADFKTKLEQSAKFVAQLESPHDRHLWAEQQRLVGNEHFKQGDYKGAMDIYLTCLVVKENTPEFVRWFVSL